MKNTYSQQQLEKLINNYSDYLAHLSPDEKHKETLIEHLLLVQKYFLKLINVHQLESIIDKLISSISNDEPIRLFIKEIFTKSIVAHDFGKLNPLFQIKKMNNQVESFNHKLSSGHSLIGGYLFTLVSEKNAEKYEFSENQQIFADFLILSFSYPILKHHSASLNDVKSDLSYKENIKDLSNFSRFLNGFNNLDFIEDINKYVIENFDSIFEVTDIFVKDKFSLFALLKLNYSLLTASDYYATTHFMNGWEEMESDFGIFNIKLKEKIIKNIERSEEYNTNTYQNLNNYKFEFPKEKSNNNLNKLRQNLAVEIINGIRKNINKNLFYIEAPTGSGKTNLSMLALAELFRNDLEKKENNITKVFYVFPFTTLITQTFSSLKKTLGLKNDEIVQIHSKAGFSEKTKDDDYGKKRNNIIDYQFVNYPIALLSHIKFFDILKSNRKSANYLMHRLANSIVIIDELQTYSPKEWDKVIYFINNYSKYFNIKFILMSATLPKIDKLISDKGKKEFRDIECFVNLNQNKEKYFRNPNFADRIKFDFSMLNDPEFNKNKKKDFLQNLSAKIIIESKKYKSKNNRVHTIIEFIFKKTASAFIEIANDNNKNNTFFDEIFVLSGTILEPRRREIISKLKSEEYQQKNILLITTQVVEAGVDIDMDLGFKDTSLIDSEEQLAGRINRNSRKTNCKLFLFDYDDAKTIYGNDYRYKEVKEKLNEEAYHKILQEKDFDKLYNLVMTHIKDFNVQAGYTDNLPSYLKSIRNLDFENVNKEFKLIDNSIQTTSIYVPIDIQINISNSKEQNFNAKELEFLKEKGKYNNEDFISGEKVWEVFCEIIENKDPDFTKQKKQKIIMQGLVSKFSFSISTYSKSTQEILKSTMGYEKYGFYKLENTDKIYDYNTGIKTLEFKEEIFM